MSSACRARHSWSPRPHSAGAHRALALRCALFLTACGEDALGPYGLPGDTEAGPKGCAPLGKYTYSLSCESGLVGIHQCADYYGSFPAGYPQRTTNEALCSASMGTVLPGKCPAQESLGSCTITSSTGSYGQASVITYYANANLTAADTKRACEGQGTYSPPTSASATPSDVGNDTCGSGTPSTSQNGFSFSVRTDLNGQPIQCTNYYGASASLTQSQLQGAATSQPCPSNGNVSYSCDVARGSSLGGGRYTLVYYKIDARDAPDSGDQTACTQAGGQFSTIYKFP